MGEERKAVVCKTCNGEGWVPNPNMDARDPDSPDGFACKDCGGDGFNYA